VEDAEIQKLTVSDGAVARVAAACLGADGVCHDDDFGVGGEDDIGENGGGTGGRFAIGRGVGKGVSEFALIEESATKTETR